MSLPQYALVDASPLALVTLPMSPRFGMSKATKDTDVARETHGGVKSAVALFRQEVWTMTFRVNETQLAAFETLHSAVDGQLTPFYFYWNSDSIYGRKEAGFAPVQLTIPSDPPLYDYTLKIIGEPIDVTVPESGLFTIYEEFEDPAEVNPARSRIENGANAIDGDPDTYAECQCTNTNPITPNYASLICSGAPEPTHAFTNAIVHVIVEYDPQSNVAGPIHHAELFNVRNKDMCPSANTIALIATLEEELVSTATPVAKAEFTHTIDAASWASDFSSLAANIYVRFGQWHSLLQAFSPDVLYKVYKMWITYE